MMEIPRPYLGREVELNPARERDVRGNLPDLFYLISA